LFSEDLYLNQFESARKCFVVDTSVLLYDKNSIQGFGNNDLIIPLVVLDEVDRFKEKPGILGENARYVNRYLDSLRETGSLHKGVTLPTGQRIAVDIGDYKIPTGLKEDYGDNRIIACAVGLKDEGNNVVVVTKDINFRVKCDALGIYSEDYKRDKINVDKSELYAGNDEISVDPEVIDRFYSDEELDDEDLMDSTVVNQYVLLKDHNGRSALGCRYKTAIKPLKNHIDKSVPLSGKNKEQKFAIDMLSRDEIKVCSLTGIAGSGKTYMTLISAMSGLQLKKYERIVITRSMQTVGKDIGFLPGDINDKMDPWLGPIMDNFRQAFKDLTWFNMMREKGQIEVVPLAFIRGRTFSNTFLIVDEAQNSTIHELKTIITRVGEGSKIVLLGDIEQIDTPYLDTMSNGLTIAIEKLKGEDLFGHITLTKGERSEVATLASKIFV
jgi:PhoH-like ATPase